MRERLTARAPRLIAILKSEDTAAIFRPNEEMEAEVGTQRMPVLVAGVACIIAILHGAAAATVGKLSQNDSAVGLTMMMSRDVAGGTESIRNVSVVDQPPGDHPIGAGAIITPVSVERAKHLNDATLSIFLVDYPPGTSAVLHRVPSSKYVLVHVLSGTIGASAWHAGVGTYPPEPRGWSLLSPTALRPQIRVINNQLEHSLFSLHKIENAHGLVHPVV